MLLLPVAIYGLYLALEQDAGGSIAYFIVLIFVIFLGAWDALELGGGRRRRGPTRLEAASALRAQRAKEATPPSNPESRYGPDASDETPF